MAPKAAVMATTAAVMTATVSYWALAWLQPWPTTTLSPHLGEVHHLGKVKPPTSTYLQAVMTAPANCRALAVPNLLSESRA
jgi:hypothetical protein